MPLHTKQPSKLQRLRRLLDNPKLSAEGIYQPIVQQALTGLKRQPVQLLLDRVVLTSSQNLLVVSVGFRRRSSGVSWPMRAPPDLRTSKPCSLPPSPCCPKACVSPCRPTVSSAP
jgi:hypothetical protein